MPLVTPISWQDFRGVAVTGDDLASATAICAMVDQAIRRQIYPFVPEPVTITDHVFDAPVGHKLTLPVIPVRSITSLYVRWGANGDSTAFTADNLLTPYTDYWMEQDDPVRGYSRSGLVYRRGSSSWGCEWVRPVNRLASDLGPNRGAVKATWLAGPASVPDDLFGVAASAVTLLFNRRLSGTPVTSESWNGYSYSTPAPFLTSFLQTPDVLDVLNQYRQPFRFAVG